MEKKNKYDELVDSIMDLVGGKENISFFTHCVTRLRFNVKDRSLVNIDEIEKIDIVVGTNWAGAQLQIIIGQSVGDAYKLICDKYGFEQEEAIDENLDDNDKKFNISINSIFDAISGCITPLLYVLIGCGMIKVLIILLGLCGISTDSSTCQILTFVGDAGFYFLPILVGYTAAKKFGANEGLGMVIGAMLIYPSFVSGISGGETYNFLGIPIYAASYANSIFPVIMCVAVMAPIERFIAKHSPDAIRSITESLLTILIMIPITYCVLGPLGAFLSQYLTAFILWLYDTTGFLGVAVLAGIRPLIVMTGMHSALQTYMISMITTAGYEPIMLPTAIINNVNQGVASFAVSLKTKDKDLQSTSRSCAITAVVAGITEPAMYGVNVKMKTPLYASMIGNFIGGAIIGIAKVYAYAFPGSVGMFGLLVCVGPTSMNFIYMIIALVVSVIVTFVGTMVLYKEAE
ncbi:MAG: PTS transporter subunit EIIC [Erysipelotrichaceae bacterium]|nr:PTS transporter subunit EIIC [Erysipelotrichaceae bacterium]